MGLQRRQLQLRRPWKGVNRTSSLSTGLKEDQGDIVRDDGEPRSRWEMFRHNSRNQATRLSGLLIVMEESTLSKRQQPAPAYLSSWALKKANNPSIAYIAKTNLASLDGLLYLPPYTQPWMELIPDLPPNS